MTNKPWKLNPSDFAFLWERCKRCFYLKVVDDFNRPRMPFPRIFGVIDSAMKVCFEGRHTSEIMADLPPGTIEFGDRWVISTPIQVRGHTSKCYVRGKIDSVIKCDDGTYAVIDFKTSSTKSDHNALYSRQLHAYAYALEHAKAGQLNLSPVTRLGLIVYEPSQFSSGSGSAALLSGKLEWLEIRRDEESFLRFISQVLQVLELPAPPSGSPNCEWCDYREESRRTGL